MTVPNPIELRVLLVPPTRRDGEITCELLARESVDCVVCSSARAVVDAIADGVGLIILTDASVNDPTIASLIRAIGQQPAWSDIPVLLMSRDRAAVTGFLDELTNVTVLDRPSSTRSMVSAVKVGLRARRRQYQLREQLLAQQRAEFSLREADQRKDEFLAMLAHELRNPLAAIRTGVDLAARKPSDAQRERVLGMIDRQTRLLIKLIDDLMDVSRIATGKVALRLERLDLRAVLEVALESGQTLFGETRHQFVLELPSHAVWVMGDPPRLAQIVGNLINNAGKYTPNGGRITVALTQRGDDALISIADTGVGIAPELLERVFEMFAQVDRTLDRAQGGLGIGLSLVRRLAELHGGTVSAHSDGLDKGSTFVVRLPLAMVEPAIADAQPLKHSVATPAALKALVIDDNKDAADGLAELLELEGLTTRTAYSGAGGLEQVQVFAPDVVFCDIGMPGMTGHEVAAQLRGAEIGNRPLLIAVTGWGNEGDQRKSRAAGFDLHITKPISVEQIDETLVRLSQRAAKRSETPGLTSG